MVFMNEWHQQEAIIQLPRVKSPASNLSDILCFETVPDSKLLWNHLPQPIFKIHTSVFFYFFIGKCFVLGDKVFITPFWMMPFAWTVANKTKQNKRNQSCSQNFTDGRKASVCTQREVMFIFKLRKNMNSVCYTLYIKRVEAPVIGKNGSVPRGLNLRHSA